MNDLRVRILLLSLCGIGVILGFVWVLRDSPRHATDQPAPSPNDFDIHSISAQTAGVDALASLGAAQSFSLANGLTVVVIPDANGADIAHMVWYKVGSIDDPPGKSGLAHFVEHLTFGGTRTRTERQFTEVLTRVGDRQDAITSYDHTVYFQLVRKENLEKVMSLEADRMNNVVVSERSMEVERKAVIEERRGAEKEPAALLDEQMRHVMFPGHPYGKPVLGLAAEFAQITSVDAANFYRQWYMPNNAVLVLHGPIDATLAKSLAEKYYAGIPARPLRPRALPPMIAPQFNASVVVKNRRLPSAWKRDNLVPSETAGTNEYDYAFQILAEILGGNPDSWLHEVLVEERKLAHEVSVQYERESIDLATFSIFVVLRSAADIRAVGNVIDIEVRRFLENRLGEATLAHIKKHLKAKIAFPEDGIPPAARLAGEAFVRERSLDEIKKWTERVDAVTAGQVRLAAQVVFAASPSVTGTLLGADGRRVTTPDRLKRHANETATQ